MKLTAWIFALFEEHAEVLIALVALAHIALLVAVCGCLWSQTPKQERMSRRFGDVEAKKA
jgi:hypothetical protein